MRENGAVPRGLEKVINSISHISTKQVPSSTLLSRTGNPSTRTCGEVLFEGGFPLRYKSVPDGETQILQRADESSASSSSRSSTLQTIIKNVIESNAMLGQRDLTKAVLDGEFYAPPQPESLGESKSFGTPASASRPSPLRRVVGIEYADPWAVHAATAYSARYLGAIPKIRVWSGDGYRIQDQVPNSLFKQKGGPGIGKPGNKIRFIDVASVDAKLHLLFHHTHWGNYLQKGAYDKTHEHHGFCVTLKKRLKSFLKCKPDPLWSKRYTENVYATGQPTTSPKTRSQRLIECLKTVDGMFVQRFLAYPEEAWCWEKFDQYTLHNLSHLLGDEFYDGELTEQTVNITTAYAELKSARKMFKLHAHKHADELYQPVSYKSVPDWLSTYVPVWNHTMKLSGHQYLLKIGLLTQTRGCGTPPPLFLLQSKIKFLRTVSSEPKPVNQTALQLLRTSVDKVLDSIPDDAFTGLATKARISVTTSACWERTRQEGGTVEQIRRLVSLGSEGFPVKIRDLETGAVTGSGKLPDLEIGEYIFWACLEDVLCTPPEELRKASLVVVHEPGKGRSITKGHASLKIVLDVISKVCASPLEKGLMSSASGMGKANHGWNFFRDLYESGEVPDLFDVVHREEQELEESIERTDYYKDFFVSSTDYEEATDYLHHTVARAVGERWMRKCGIPKLLIAVVCKICYQPRSIYFTAKGPLKNIGRSTEFNQKRSIIMRRGVLMGDPMTKVVLHIINASVRLLGEKAFDSDFLQSAFNNPQQVRERLLSVAPQKGRPKVREVS